MTDILIKLGATEVPIEGLTLPTSRMFRDAWTLGETVPDLVSCDMIKARDIYRDRLRQLRKSRFEALDVEYMRAMEGDESSRLVTAIFAEKQLLRDAPEHPSIEAAQTPAELMALTIAGLKVG